MHMEKPHKRCITIAQHLLASGRDVYVVSYARTPIGSFNGALSSVSAPKLGSVAIEGVLNKVGSKLDVGDIDEVIVGHVLQAGCGQAPARQSALASGIPKSVPCSSVNKVCASGLKALTTCALSISGGYNDVCVAAGMESMSQVPYMLNSLRVGKKLGDETLSDGLVKDGLWDVYNNQHMGNCAEKTARDFGLSRNDVDEYAAESVKRALAARDAGYFKREIVPVQVLTDKESKSVHEDEQLSKVNPAKLPTLKTSFEKGGCITAGNASPISDGAAAVLLMSREAMQIRNIAPVAKVIAWADGERDPIDFGIAPSIAINNALAIAGLKAAEIDLWEINEAFAAVALANMKLFPDMSHDKVNVHGGAVALGHPLGCSGTRIVCTLLNAMQIRNASLGCAAICNGGGGATAVIFRLV